MGLLTARLSSVVNLAAATSILIILNVIWLADASSKYEPEHISFIYLHTYDSLTGKINLEFVGWQCSTYSAVSLLEDTYSSCDAPPVNLMKNSSFAQKGVAQ